MHKLTFANRNFDADFCLFDNLLEVLEILKKNAFDIKFGFEDIERLVNIYIPNKNVFCTLL